MARIHQALQRKTDGRWDYTVSSDEEGWAHPAGYCGGWKEWTEEDEKRTAIPWLRAEQEKHRLFKDKYHTDGHATPEEARRCHREYELDQDLEAYEEEGAQRQCEVCSAWTTRRMQLGQFHRFTLCDAHATRDNVAALAEKPRQ